MHRQRIGNYDNEGGAEFTKNPVASRRKKDHDIPSRYSSFKKKKNSARGNFEQKIISFFLIRGNVSSKKKVERIVEI